MKQTTLAILAAMLIIAACQDQKAPGEKTDGALINDNVKKRIDSTLQSIIDSNKTVGVSALVFEKGKEVYFNSFGFADREAQKKMERNTIVRIFSMTKPITGVALMSLYEKGLFQLDDSLSKYLPEFANMKVRVGKDAKGNDILEPAKRAITVRDITRHTSGLPDVRFDFEKDLSSLMKRLAQEPLLFHPGDEWRYGISVDVQAALVEKLSGKPFDQYLQETIFTPMQMTETRYTIPAADLGRFAVAYNRNDSTGVLTRVPDTPLNNLNTKNNALKPGGWGLVSTLDDYMKFAQMLVHEGAAGETRILKAETVKLMATNQLPDTLSKRSWLPGKGQVGFGIDFAVRMRPPADADERSGTVGEFFWDGAASTLFWVDPKNELTAVIFTQLFPFDKVNLHKKFRDAIYGPYKP